MDHHTTWFSFLPWFQDAQHAVDGQRGILFGNPATVQHVFAGVLVVLVLLVLSLRARGQLAKAPDGGLIPSPKFSLLGAFDLVLEKVYRQLQATVGKEASRYFPVMATLTMFIFFSNVLGLVPGFVPPTDNWNTTIAVGLFSFLYYNFHGLRVAGWHHLAHIANPAGVWWGWFLAPLMLPIELVGHFSRPFTLGIRLATNMIGDHAVLFAFLGLVPILVPLPFLALGLLVCVIQTLVFVLLSMIYLKMAIEVAHHDDHDEHHQHGGQPAPAH